MKVILPLMQVECRHVDGSRLLLRPAPTINIQQKFKEIWVSIDVHGKTKSCGWPDCLDLGPSVGQLQSLAVPNRKCTAHRDFRNGMLAGGARLTSHTIMSRIMSRIKVMVINL